MPFLTDVSYNFVKRAVMLFCGLVMSIAISRLLGPTERGIYSLVMLLPALLLLFGDIGVQMANVYYLGKKRVHPSMVASNSLLLGLVAGSFLTLLSFLLLPVIAPYILPEVPISYALIAVVSVPFSLASSFLLSIIVGLRQIKKACTITIAISIGTTASSIFVLLALNGNVGALILLFATTAIAVFVFALYYIWKVTGFSSRFSRQYLKESFGYGSKAYLANLLFFFNSRIGYFMLGYFVGAEGVGYFSVSTGLAEMIFILPSTVDFVLFPTVANLDSRDAGSLTAMSCKYVFFMSLILCIAAALLGGFAIVILFGELFLPSYLPLLLLLPGVLLSSTGSLTGAYLAGIGKIIYAPIIMGSALVMTVFLNLTLIPLFGLVGASAATSICYAYAGMLSMFFFMKHSQLGLNAVYSLKRKDIAFFFDQLFSVFRKQPKHPSG